MPTSLSVTFLSPWEQPHPAPHPSTASPATQGGDGGSWSHSVTQPGMELKEGENRDPGKKMMRKYKISGPFAAKRNLISATT